MRNHFSTLLFLGISACSTTPVTVGGEPSDGQALSGLLDEAIDAGVVGVALYVQRPEQPLYYEARGLANIERDESLTPDHLFRIASMAKPYLSALMVKLEVEGKLSLDDKITQYLPADILALIPNAERISIWDMLTHWSGIIDYRDAQFSEEVVFGPHDVVRDEYEDLIAGLARNPQGCAPPELPPDEIDETTGACLYSSSNYVLAGYIVDKVLYGVDPAPGIRPEHHSRAFREQLFEPLDLQDTFYEKHLAAGESFEDRLAHGYFSLPTRDGSTPARSDITSYDDGNGYANGGLISTLRDVATFRRAMFDPERAYPMADLSAKRRFLARYTERNPVGVAPAGFLDDANRWLNTGDISGYSSWSAFDLKSDTSILLYTNDRDFEDGRLELANAVSKVVEMTADADK